MANSFPFFDPEGISAALLTQLQTASGLAAGQFKFSLVDRIGAVPTDIPSANQPYMGLVEVGASQVETQAQGLEKWILHYRLLVYLRADASPEIIPATQLNSALLAIVTAMRSQPIGERQTLGGVCIHAWIEGDVIIDTGIIDQQCALLIPIKVLVGL